MSCIKFLEKSSLPYFLPFETILSHECTFQNQCFSQAIWDFEPSISIYWSPVSIDDSRANRSTYYWKLEVDSLWIIISDEFCAMKRNQFSIKTKQANLHRAKSFIEYSFWMWMQLLRPQNKEFHYIFSFYCCKWSLKFDNLTNSLKICWFRKNFLVRHLKGFWHSL